MNLGVYAPSFYLFILTWVLSLLTYNKSQPTAVLCSDGVLLFSPDETHLECCVQILVPQAG